MAASPTDSRLSIRLWTALPETQREQIGRVWHFSRMWFGAVFIIFGLVLALTWQAAAGLAVAALGSITVIDAGIQHRRQPGREPLLSALIDAG